MNLDMLIRRMEMSMETMMTRGPFRFLGGKGEQELSF